MTSVRKFVMQLAPHGVLLSGSRRQDHFVTKISFQCLGKPELFLSVYDPFEPETDLPASGPLPDLWPPTDALREDWQRAWLREAVSFDTFRTAIRTIVRALSPYPARAASEVSA